MNNIPVGYKQTDVGVIPEDWEVKKLGDIANFASGTTPRRENHERYFQNGNIFWVKTMDLNNSEIHETSEKVTDIALKETSSLKVFPVDTVLIAMYGGFNQIGRTGILKINACVNQALTAVQPNKNILIPLFLINFLNYRIDSWKDVATSSRKDPNITSKDIKDFFTVIPPISEQAAIATALSDVDALISALDKLIAKKRLIKQGAMQELLSGKKRLAGFSGDWEVKKLGDIGIFKGGNGFPIKYQGNISGKYPFFKVSDMNNEGNNKIMENSNNWVDENTKKILSLFLFPKKSIIFAKIGAAIFLERKKILCHESCLDNNMMGFIFNCDLFNHEFIYYLFHTIKLGSLVSTTALPSLNNKELEQLQFKFPKIKEQTAIAQILSDMDSDIQTLETERNKTLAIKQGMMQNLLTGKIRLI